MSDQTLIQIILTLAIISAITVMTRALPFILFPGSRKTPEVVSYLGIALPYACMAMLVVYCFKNISIFEGYHGIPEFIAGAFVIAVHRWKHNMLLSIMGGTVVYMLLVQLVFV